MASPLLFWNRFVSILLKIGACGLMVGMGVGGSKLAVGQTTCLIVTPKNLTVAFAPRAVGTLSLQINVGVTNGCKAPLQVNSVVMSPAASAFRLILGWAPVTLDYNQTMTYQLRFEPIAPQAYTGTFTVNVQGYNPVVFNLSGTGQLPGAVGSWNTTSLSFNSVPLGRTSAPQTAILTNTGTQAAMISSLYVDPPFSVSGFTNTRLGVGKSLPLQVTFTPQYAGSFNGTLVVVTDRLPPTGVTLNATAVAPIFFGISSFPSLPAATAGFTYMANLQSAGGVGTVSWALNSGSNLPAGLSLSSAGAISGTVASTVAVGKYPFTVTATDSNTPPSTSTVQFTLPVGAPTGASCQYIQANVAGSTTPIMPLPDLGTGTYLGAQGGLYPNGSNIMPADHDADGLAFANAIQPLDANGNPDPNGKYAIISIGMSVTATNFALFTQDASADPSVNRNLVFVPGAQPRVTADLWANPTFPAWGEIFQYFLPQSGVTANQVVAAWVESVLSGTTGTFPSDMTKLQADLETTAQLLHTNFPNLTLALFSPREYGAYSAPRRGDPEPYSYESGFAVRGMIEDQMNGAPGMNYNLANGPVMAPWVGWGPYLWANGLIPRSDGLVWTCQDFQGDGLHPSVTTGGSEKNAYMMMEFFKTTDVTAPWFLAH